MNVVCVVDMCEKKKKRNQPSWECKFCECNGVNEVNCCECNCVNQVNFYKCNCVNQVVYEKEQKGPVSTLAHINGFLLTAIGQKVLVMIIIDNFCIALLSGIHKLIVLYNILQLFLSYANVIHLIMTPNNV